MLYEVPSSCQLFLRHVQMFLIQVLQTTDARSRIGCGIINSRPIGRWLRVIDPKKYRLSGCRHCVVRPWLICSACDHLLMTNVFVGQLLPRVCMHVRITFLQLSLLRSGRSAEYCD